MKGRVGDGTTLLDCHEVEWKKKTKTCISLSGVPDSL